MGNLLGMQQPQMAGMNPQTQTSQGPIGQFQQPTAQQFNPGSYNPQTLPYAAYQAFTNPVSGYGNQWNPFFGPQLSNPYQFWQNPTQWPQQTIGYPPNMPSGVIPPAAGGPTGSTTDQTTTPPAFQQVTDIPAGASHLTLVNKQGDLRGYNVNRGTTQLPQKLINRGWSIQG